MNYQMSFNEEQSKFARKLRKREMRLTERLEEARLAHDRAVERFQRAQSRVQRRAARVERLEGRLQMIRQQLTLIDRDAFSDTQAANFSADSIGLQTQIQNEEVSPENFGRENAPFVELNDSQYGPTVGHKQENPLTDIEGSELFDDEEVEESLSEEQILHDIAEIEREDDEETFQTQPRIESITEEIAITHIPTMEEEQRESREENSREEEQTPNLEEETFEELFFSQEEEDFLRDLVASEELEKSEVGELSAEPHQQMVNRDQEEREEPLSEPEHGEEVSHSDTSMLAREARAVAEAAEEEARRAVERVEEVSRLLEQAGLPRHIIQGIDFLQERTEQNSSLALEVQGQSGEIENLAEVSPPEPLADDTLQESEPLSSVQSEAHEMPLEEGSAFAQLLANGEGAKEAQSPVEESADLPVEDSAQPNVSENGIQDHTSGTEADKEARSAEIEAAKMVHPIQTDEASQQEKTTVGIQEIEDEEVLLETVAAMIIADAAAAAAAEAEALAEASSARTRKARAQVRLAEQALQQVQVAIRNGVLSGEEAQNALKDAEREATHAHALLADAEVAEERALSAAINAEAEAEVAEGMAFSATSRSVRTEPQQERLPVLTLPERTITDELDDVELQLDEEEEDDDEDTLKMPAIRRPQQGHE